MRLNKAQRIVIVVAWGLAMMALADWANGRRRESAVSGISAVTGGDWFNYSPGLGPSMANGDLGFKLLALALWIVPAILLLRDSRKRPEGDA